MRINWLKIWVVATALVATASWSHAQQPASGSLTYVKCDPSYPEVCIPPPPPDLDCGEIPHDDFIVLPPDPHGFDRDEDGIGCET